MAHWLVLRQLECETVENTEIKHVMTHNDTTVGTGVTVQFLSLCGNLTVGLSTHGPTYYSVTSQSVTIRPPNNARLHLTVDQFEV